MHSNIHFAASDEPKRTRKDYIFVTLAKTLARFSSVGFPIGTSALTRTPRAFFSCRRPHGVNAGNPPIARSYHQLTWSQAFVLMLLMLRYDAKTQNPGDVLHPLTPISKFGSVNS